MLGEAPHNVLAAPSSIAAPETPLRDGAAQSEDTLAAGATPTDTLLLKRLATQHMRHIAFGAHDAAPSSLALGGSTDGCSPRDAGESVFHANVSEVPPTSPAAVLSASAGDEGAYALAATLSAGRLAVLQCASCRSIIGDTSACASGPARVETELTPFAAVILGAQPGVRREDALHTSLAATDYGSTYHVLACTGCGSAVGRTYRTTSPELDGLRGRHALACVALRSHVLSTPAPAPALRAAPADAVAGNDVSARIAVLEDDVAKVKRFCLHLFDRVVPAVTDRCVRPPDEPVRRPASRSRPARRSTPAEEDMPSAKRRYVRKTPAAETAEAPASLPRAEDAPADPPATASLSASRRETPSRSSRPNELAALLSRACVSTPRTSAAGEKAEPAPKPAGAAPRPKTKKRPPGATVPRQPVSTGAPCAALDDDFEISSARLSLPTASPVADEAPTADALKDAAAPKKSKKKSSGSRSRRNRPLPPLVLDEHGNLVRRPRGRPRKDGTVRSLAGAASEQDPLAPADIAEALPADNAPEPTVSQAAPQ